MANKTLSLLVSKKFRRILALAGGIAIAVMATIFMLLLDTKMKFEVLWLIGLSVFGLAGGVLQVLGALDNNGDDRSKKAILLCVSMVFIVALDVVLLLIKSNETYVSLLEADAARDFGDKKYAFIPVVYYITLVVGFIAAAISIFNFIFALRDRWTVMTFADEKSKKKVDIVKYVVVCTSMVLVIGAIVCLFTMPVASIATLGKSQTVAAGTRQKTNIDISLLDGMKTLFGGLVSYEKVETVNTTLKDGAAVNEFNKTVTTEQVQLGANIVYILGLVLSVIGAIASVCFIFIEKLRNNIIARVSAGGVTLIGGILAFIGTMCIESSYSEIIPEKTSSVSSVSFSLGSGPILCFALLLVAGFALTVLAAGNQADKPNLDE